jgi:Beta-ketoacyl synthase, C-terminal domain/Beta-ketoacyl synthase, N-terminal domain
MLSPDGRCKTLDAAADGYVRGESVITLLVHPFASAPAIVLRGTHVNQDGRSSSLTAPNGPSQQQVCLSRAMLDARHVPKWASRVQVLCVCVCACVCECPQVIATALRNAAVPPSAIGAIEMHGTGTALGDPIEVCLPIPISTWHPNDLIFSILCFHVWSLRITLEGACPHSGNQDRASLTVDGARTYASPPPGWRGVGGADRWRCTHPADSCQITACTR